VMDKYCYRPDRSEGWTRLSYTYNYSTQNSPLNFTIYNDESNTSALWAFRELIIVYRACHWACTLCYSSLASSCMACLVNGTYS
jgi:hypothetical protein